jgi:hypothetical protein
MYQAGVLHVFVIQFPRPAQAHELISHRQCLGNHHHIVPVPWIAVAVGLLCMPSPWHGVAVPCIWACACTTMTPQSLSIEWTGAAL